MESVQFLGKDALGFGQGSFLNIQPAVQISGCVAHLFQQLFFELFTAEIPEAAERLILLATFRVPA